LLFSEGRSSFADIAPRNRRIFLPSQLALLLSQASEVESLQLRTSAVNASWLPGSAKQFVSDFGHRQSRRSFALKFLAELSLLPLECH
jgi:hypothetical protein